MSKTSISAKARGKAIPPGALWLIVLVIFIWNVVEIAPVVRLRLIGNETQAVVIERYGQTRAWRPFGDRRVVNVTLTYQAGGQAFTRQLSLPEAVDQLYPGDYATLFYSPANPSRASTGQLDGWNIVYRFMVLAIAMIVVLCVFSEMRKSS